MSDKNKKRLVKIIIASVVFIPLLILEHLKLLPESRIAVFIMFLLPYLIVGHSVIQKALSNIKKGDVFDENFLMLIATLGAFAVGEYPEAAAVMLFYQIGELFEGIAVGKSRAAVSEMMNIAPEYANLETDGKTEKVDPDDVPVDSVILVRPGEKIPLDGEVIEGTSSLDTSALTGESLPRSVSAGDSVHSGCINLQGLLRIRTTKEYDDSTVARILELVENASTKKARIENFITRFARYYTPVVTILALLLALTGPLIFGGGIMKWLLRACTFLVVSCPCALVISVPLGFFGGIGAASKKGVLIKGSNYLEILANTDVIVFDKTGTLTEGVFRIRDLNCAEGVSSDELHRVAAHAESISDHPVALSVTSSYKAGIDPHSVKDGKEIPGKGIQAVYQGSDILVGNETLMKDNNIVYTPADSAGTAIYVSKDRQFLGSIIIADSIKENAAQALSSIKASGIKKVVMLTGDRPESAQDVARELKIDETHASLLPQDKVAKVEELLKELPEKRYLAFVGDGINDAPVLSRADVGIAMGAMGSDAAIEAADVVLMHDDIGKLRSVIRISRKTMAIVRENIVFSLAVKLIVLILSAIGLANMWAAVFADVGVAVLAISNSMRTLRTR